AEHLRVRARDRGGGPGAAIEERELSDHITLLVLREDEFFSFSVFDVELNLAVAEDKDLAAGIAIVEDGFALLEVAAVHHLRQRFTLFIVQEPKNRDFTDHGYVCRHEETRVMNLPRQL